MNGHTQVRAVARACARTGPCRRSRTLGRVRRRSAADAVIAGLSASPSSCCSSSSRCGPGSASPTPATTADLYTGPPYPAAAR